ncbi:MAG: hypothetical protein WKF81_10995 [Thermomicrobiales bacterium]
MPDDDTHASHAKTIRTLARTVGLDIDSERLPTLVADYVAALAMIEDLHGVETELVPASPFDPAWPEAQDDRR